MAETDPGSGEGLSEVQKGLIRDTWALVSPDLQGAGLILFTKLFEIQPDLQDLFPFSGQTLDVDHPGLRKHALDVMESIDAAIKLLDKPEELQETLVELGIIHNMKDVKLESFGPVGAALIYTLETGLKDKFTDEVKAAWVALYGAVQAFMTLGMDEGLDA